MPFDSEPKTKHPPVRLLQLFRFARCADWILMLIGLAGAIAYGVSLPAMIFTFSGLIEDLASQIAGGDNDAIMDSVEDQCVIMIIIGVGVFICSGIMMITFEIASKRQGIRARKVFFQSIFKLDLKWYDENNANEVTSQMYSCSSRFYFLHSQFNPLHLAD